MRREFIDERPHQRLRYAHARGARIEMTLHKYDPLTQRAWVVWLLVRTPGWSLSDSELRVHPRDKHLLYGPLSSALRNWVLFNENGGAALEAAMLWYEVELETSGSDYYASHYIDQYTDDCRMLDFAEYLSYLGV